MRFVFSATALIVLLVLQSACWNHISEALIESQCAPNDQKCESEKEKAAKIRGEAKLRPDQGAEFLKDFDESVGGAEKYEGKDDIVDQTDPSTWPKAKFPDIDLSGPVQEVDLSGYSFDDEDEKPDINTPPSDKGKKTRKDIEDGDPNKALDEEEAEMIAFGKIVERLEEIANEFVCTVSASAVYTVAGDDQVFDLLVETIEKSLTKMGQDYGSKLIKNWETDRVRKNHTCDGIPRLDESRFELPVTFLLESKNLFSQWLSKREVEPSELVDTSMPIFRKVFSRWFTMRLMLATPTTTDGRIIYPDSLALKMIPFIKDDDSPSDTCASAAGLYTAYFLGDIVPGDEVKEKILKMIDVCYSAGRASDKPVEYGRHLMTANRTKEARELFELAVTRGEICHALQRPENLHRKDLTARALWSEDFFPEFRHLKPLLPKLTEKLDALEFVKASEMVNFLRVGTWEVASVLQDTVINATACTALGDALCGELKEFFEIVEDANDGYLFGCNGTMTFEFWRFTPPARSETDTGTANIVVQVLVPLREGEGNTLTIRAGEEVTLLSEGEITIFDDTFENSMELTTENPANPSPMYLLHMQICHPDMHDKALVVPGKKCSTDSAEDVKE